LLVGVVGVVGAGAAAAAALPNILNMTVPQVGHLPLDGFAAVFHGFFNAIGDGLFGLAFDAVSFRHKEVMPPTLHAPNGVRRLPVMAGKVKSKGKWLKIRHKW